MSALPIAALPWLYNELSSCCSHDRIINNQNLESCVTAYLADKHNNRCSMLPADLDPQSSLVLSVKAELAESSSPPPQFAVNSVAQPGSLQRSDTYEGQWTSAEGELRMPDLAIVGPPGSIQLTLTGGHTRDGQRLKAGMLTLQLQPGKMTRVRFSGWPSGVFPV